MQRLHWHAVTRGDEYAEQGDTHFVDAPSAAFYYNPKRSVVRRYGMDGDYGEFNVRGRPEARNLSTMYSMAKRQGRLHAVETGAFAA